ncbi:MAG: FtsW/RodA/SpoVE family cell cycle protein [Candidatus Sericytochromatia bacterium]|nr:FtsW/RodA/SpoVE family cell cycle protein [Candidatus Tanganyikabacteria bacterium]
MTRPKPDLPLVFTCILLLVFGLAMVFSASAPTAVHWGKGIFYVLKNQGVYALIGLAGGFAAWKVGIRSDLSRIAALFHWLAFGVTAMTLFFGVRTLGATRWLSFMGVSLQPSEFLKPTMVLWLASRCLVPHDKPLEIGRTLLLVVGPLALIIIGQSDLGTGLCVAAGGFIAGVMAGMPLWIIGGTLAAGVAGVLAVFLAGGYRATRIQEWLLIGHAHPGPPTQAEQSLMAIGHGGLGGEGFGMGTQKFGHLAIAHTDFIFAIVAEEVGFIGGLLLILAFLYLVLRAFQLAQRTEDPFARAAMVGLAGGITGQALLNIGVAVALVPVTGVPLPFISQGGSSLVGTCISMGLCLGLAARVERRRKPRAPFATEEPA